MPIPFRNWRRVIRPDRILTILVLAGLAVTMLATGCGREAPSIPELPVDPPVEPPVDPPINLPETGLLVDSNPQGAAILLDGKDTSEVTPHTFTGLPVGDVEISLDLPGYLMVPATYTASVTEGDTVRVAADTFTARAQRLVLLEGFANINCIPCPQLTENLLLLTTQDGYGVDRVAFVEFASFFPNFRDPFYRNAQSHNDARAGFYGIGAAPALIVDGVLQTSPTDYALMVSAVDDALLMDPGILVDVTADLGAADVDIAVEITAFRDVDLSGHSLYVAIFQNEKRRLFLLAYNMLGSRMDAEDVLQDAFLRWQGVDRESIRVPEDLRTAIETLEGRKLSTNA